MSTSTAEHITIAEETRDKRTPEEAAQFIGAIARSPMNSQATALIERAEQLAADLAEFNATFTDDSINEAVTEAGFAEQEESSAESMRNAASDILRATRGFSWACQQFATAAGSAAW